MQMETLYIKNGCVHAKPSPAPPHSKKEVADPPGLFYEQVY